MSSQGTDWGGTRRFPTTRWADMLAARESGSKAYLAAFNLFVGRYWKPIYCYIQRRGYDNEQAKDLTQEFLLSWFEGKTLGRADPARGHLRAFLLTCLVRFLIAYERRQHAQRRFPSAGLISIKKLARDCAELQEPDGSLTPEAIFNRQWALSVLDTAVRGLANVLREKRLHVHEEIFRRRIIEPLRGGARPPSLRELA